MKPVLAIDLGGTNLRAAIHTGDIAALAQPSRHAAPTSLDAFIARISTLAEAANVEALGLAVPGLVEGSVCRWIPNLPWLDGVDVAALFPHLAVTVGNDAQIALLAEAVAGAARGTGDAILLAIGTGIGSAVLAGGRIIAGAHGGACSFGWACAELEHRAEEWMPVFGKDDAATKTWSTGSDSEIGSGAVEDEGEPRSGWLERVASGRALDALAGRIGLSSGGKLIDAARAGDRTALALVEEPARRLGTALAGAVGLLDPGVILVSGGLADALDVIAPPLLAALRRQLPPHLCDITLKSGDFGPRAGLVGAALAGAAGSRWREVR